MVKDMKLEPHDELILQAAMFIAGETNYTTTPSLYDGRVGVFNILHNHFKQEYEFGAESKAYNALLDVAKAASIPKTIQMHGRTYVLQD